VDGAASAGAGDADPAGRSPPGLTIKFLEAGLLPGPLREVLLDLPHGVTVTL